MEEDYGIDESAIPQTAGNDPSVFDTLLLSDLLSAQLNVSYLRTMAYVCGF